MNISQKLAAQTTQVASKFCRLPALRDNPDDHFWNRHYWKFVLRIKEISFLGT